MSSAHAIFITVMSLYLVFFSDLFSDRTEGLVIFRSSSLSIFTLGVRTFSMIFTFVPTSSTAIRTVSPYADKFDRFLLDTSCRTLQ